MKCHHNKKIIIQYCIPQHNYNCSLPKKHKPLPPVIKMVTIPHFLNTYISQIFFIFYLHESEQIDSCEIFIISAGDMNLNLSTCIIPILKNI